MCTQVRHRLTKLLHSSKLRWCHRVALYRACIRSSQLFSQHAVGLTAAVQYCGGWSQQMQEACVRLREAPPYARE